VKQTRKSASIEIAVNGISDYKSPSSNASSIAAALVGVDRLYRYWKDHRAILEDTSKTSSPELTLSSTGQRDMDLWSKAGLVD
jgi:hypothetical protein